MTVQFNHNGTTSASLAVWMCIVPNETMRCPLLLGRDSWMRFHSRSYQTLPPQPDGRIFGELTLSSCDDNFSSAAAYIRNCETLDAAYHLVYNGPGVTLTDSPQVIPVNLVRLDGLTGHGVIIKLLKRCMKAQQLVQCMVPRALFGGIWNTSKSVYS